MFTIFFFNIKSMYVHIDCTRPSEKKNNKFLLSLCSASSHALLCTIRQFVSIFLCLSDICIYVYVYGEYVQREREGEIGSSCCMYIKEAE